MRISTSILNAKDRSDCVKKLNNTNTTYIHIDVMDGKFVPNIELNTKEEITCLNYLSNHKLDIHLMVENPMKYIEELSNMNIEYITFHIEVKKNIKKIISKIKDLGYKVGISIKPNTNIDKLIPYINDIDLILIMSVEPGKGGQQFLPNTPERIKKIKELIDNNRKDITPIKIEVDGGINNETIKLLNNVDIAVVGSYITKSDNYYSKIESLLHSINNINIKEKKPNQSKNIIIILLIICIIIIYLVSIVYQLNK